MNGHVTPEREARLRITLRGPAGAHAIDALIDTGFDGYLTMRKAEIAALQLPHHSRVRAMLADGSRVPLEMYAAETEWDGGLRAILVVESEGDPLLGMRLLYGHRLTIDVIDGGPVTIASLPP